MRRRYRGPDGQEMDSADSTNIEEASTSKRLITVLHSRQIETVGDIERMTSKEFTNTRGCGLQTRKDMAALMKRFHLKFSDTPVAKDKPANKLDRPSWDQYFLDIAATVSTRSLDPSLKVGTVVVDTNRRIVATGYNGFPPGFPDSELPLTRPEKYVYTVHAEANAIASSRTDLRHGTLYCTHSPCNECAKIIITSGITRVVFGHVYATTPAAEAQYEFTLRLFKMGKVDKLWLKPQSG